MDNNQLPIYLISDGVDWIALGSGLPEGTVTAYGTIEDARAAVATLNRQYGPKEYRIVEYRISGVVDGPRLAN